MSIDARRLADATLEASVVGGFSRIGPAARRRLFRWAPLPSLSGRTVAITGATSGLGRELALEAASLRASVVLLIRDRAKGDLLAMQLRETHGTTVSIVEVDLGDLAAVRRAAEELSRLDQLDALVHNAGTLSAEWATSPQGHEQTLSVHVLGPYLLTRLVLPSLLASDDPRVVVVTSGGMYTQDLDVEHLDAPKAGYVGSVAYARCKRAQVSLVEQLAPRLDERGVLLRAYHPGWADTEGVRSSLPRFRAVMRPLLRTPAEGVDTALWLLGAPREEIGEGVVYCDRAPRHVHRLRRTARSDTSQARHDLEAHCATWCGIEDDDGGACT